MYKSIVNKSKLSNRLGRPVKRILLTIQFQFFFGGICELTTSDFQMIRPYTYTKMRKCIRGQKSQKRGDAICERPLRVGTIEFSIVSIQWYNSIKIIRRAIVIAKYLQHCKYYPLLQYINYKSIKKFGVNLSNIRVYTLKISTYSKSWTMYHLL